MPAANASASTGALWLSVAKPGRSSENRPAVLSRNACRLGLSLITVWNVGGVCEIQFWRNGTATGASARNVVSRFTYRSACVWATGASALRRTTRARGRTRPGRSAVTRGSSPPGSRSRSSGTNAPIALLRSLPRPASASLKPIVVSLIALRRLRIEHRQDLIEIDLGARLADRDSRSVRDMSARGPRADLEVLEADRALQPDVERRVDRQRLDGLVEAQLEQRDRLSLRVACRRDRRHVADERAAHVDLSSVRQFARVADLHVEVVLRDERQAVVRLVGEGHRDDRREHRERPDQDRVREDALLASGRDVSRPAPDQVVEQALDVRTLIAVARLPRRVRRIPCDPGDPGGDGLRHARIGRGNVGGGARAERGLSSPESASSRTTRRSRPPACSAQSGRRCRTCSWRSCRSRAATSGTRSRRSD